MTVRKVDIAAHLGVSRQAVNAFSHQGMPTDTLEGASAWYNARRAARGADAGTPEKRVTPSDQSFAEIVAQHRALKDKAYDKYLEDIDNRDPNQSKSYATYDKLLKTMVALERESQARDIASRKYIEASVATAAFGKVLEAVRGEMLQMSAQVAPRANPDDPRMAMKAIDQAVARMLSRLSGAAVDAIEAVTEPADKVVVTDAPEPEDSESDV